MVHEWGHFIAAKSLGMKVEEFAIGFGPKIFSFQKGETLYSLRIVPLGGFNKIAGMDAEEGLDSRSYLTQPIWSRAIVIAAGSAMNLILPIFLLFLIYTGVGMEQPINDPVVGQVMAGRAASQAGLQADDRILSIEGMPVNSWNEMIQGFQKNPSGQTVTLEIVRNGVNQKLMVTPEHDAQSGRNLIGVMAKTQVVKVGVVEGAQLAFKQTWALTKGIAGGLYQMISGKSAVELSGPIGVARMAGDVAKSDGVVGLLGFAAFLSINLGFVNLLPIPALDGGHLLVLLVEAVRGKQLTPNQAYRIQMVGVAFLLTMFLLVTTQDILRLFN